MLKLSCHFEVQPKAQPELIIEFKNKHTQTKKKTVFSIRIETKLLNMQVYLVTSHPAIQHVVF